MTAFFSFFLVSSCLTPPQRGPQSDAPGASDALLTLYRNQQFQPLVIEYYTKLTGNRDVALAILETSNELEIDPSLAFALAWNESRFNPRAVNYNATTSDRGLFQLNSKTFPRLTRQALFDPKSNATHGLRYYKMAYDKLGDEAKALGYYNSGIGLLTDRALPRSTQAYIKRILADRQTMDRDAIAWIYFSHETVLTSL